MSARDVQENSVFSHGDTTAVYVANCFAKFVQERQ